MYPVVNTQDSILRSYSKEVWKLNFGQFGQMEKHSQEKARTGRKSAVRRSEVEKNWKRSKREKVRREKMQAGERVEKSRNTVFFSDDLWLRRVEK